MKEWTVPANVSPGKRFWLLSFQAAWHRSELSRYDRVIAHYPNYALPLYGHRGLIGLSHGVTWDCETFQGVAHESVTQRPGDGSYEEVELHTLRDRVKKGLARAAFRCCRGYVSNDTFFLREMGLPVAPGSRRWEEVAPGKWHLPNAVDTERFSPDPATPREPVILLARNFYRNRGIHIGIEAFARIAGEWPDLRLRLAGDEGDRGYREECEALTKSLKLRDRVEFVGSIPWGRMAGEYRRAAMSWVPSLCGEGTSLSALESMACGTPVVASTAGGLPDLPCLHAGLMPEEWARVSTEVLQQREAVSHRQMEAVRREFTLRRWGEAWRTVVEQMR